MESSTVVRNSLFSLFRALTGDTKTLIRQEIQLAKTELSEKLSTMGRNTVSLAIGGVAAYAGLIVFLIGLGWLFAWLLKNAGLDPYLASFIGIAGTGLLVAVIGVVLLMKGIKTLKNQSLKPEKTLYTLQELKGGHAPVETRETEKASSEEMQARVEATEDRMGQTLDELGYRLSPERINAQVKQKIQSDPYRAGLIAMGVGVLSGLFLRRKLRHA
jgi:ElaB/YqjD/DUF883 family membrane-anchored ribosome-binding protein